MTIKNEILRKSIHFTTLVIPVSYFIFEKKVVLLVLGTVVFFALFIELIRLRWPWFSKLFLRIFGRLLREHERTHLTGSTYLLISSFLAILLFEKWIALVSLLFLIISDALGALIGRLWGTKFIYRDRSVEGCGVFILTSIIIVFIVPNSRLEIALPGVMVAFIIDLFVRRIDDNITIPLGSGIFMEILSKI